MSDQKKNVIKLVAGLAATVAVQILAGGHWSHAVWVPALILLAAPVAAQANGVSQTTKRAVMIGLGLAATGAVELLAKGPWAHAVWAPSLLLMFTDVVKVSGVDNLLPSGSTGDSRLDERLKKPAADDPPSDPPKAA